MPKELDKKFDIEGIAGERIDTNRAFEISGDTSGKRGKNRQAQGRCVRGGHESGDRV